MAFEKSELLQNLPDQFFAHLVQKVNAKIAAGHDVINLGQGNPDQPTPDYILEAMHNSISDPQNHKYAQFRGLPELKSAIADFYQDEYGVTLDPETEVAILGGSKIGLVELIFSLTNPKDTVLLPNPGYPDYLSGAALGQVKVVDLPLKAENNFLPDYRQINQQDKHNAKLMYLNYPNNPTGAIATPAFYEETVSFAKQYHIGVVSDLAYGAIGFDQQKPLSFLQTPHAKDVGIEFYTFSKTFNMAGWRIGFAVGNADMIEAINLIQDHLFVSVFPAIQHAATVALNNKSERKIAISKLQNLYQERRDQFIAAVREFGWEPIVPKGAFYILMPVPAGYTSASFTDLLLNEADVAVADANGFGSLGEGYVRIGLTVEVERLLEAAKRIRQLDVFNEIIKKR